MKKIYLLLASMILFAVSCQKPEYIPSEANRQGITSISAYFTKGLHTGELLASLKVDPGQDETLDRFEILIPWFFPESSDNETRVDMTRIRLKAELAPDCSIRPSLGSQIWDLMDENKFVYTNAHGQSRDIIITGKRVKSNEADIMDFKFQGELSVPVMIDKEKQKILLLTFEDLTSCVAQIKTSAHSIIVGGELMEETNTTFVLPTQNFNNPQIIKLQAHDGTVIEYTTEKVTPNKIPYGFNKDAIKPLFNIEPMKYIDGVPAFDQKVFLSIASIEGKLVICYGDSTAPIYLDGQTGAKEGSVNVADIDVSAVCNDSNNNLLLTTLANGHKEFSLYKMNSLKGVPELICTETNPSDTPIGHTIRVMGDVNTNAVVILTCEGVPGVTKSGKYVEIVISDGKVDSVEVRSVQDAGFLWDQAPTNAAKLCPVSSNANDGVFGCYYSMNSFFYAKNGQLVNKTANPVDNTNFNTNCLNVIEFNHARYTVHFRSLHFPQWGPGNHLRIYDTSNPDELADNKPLVETPIEWYRHTTTAGCAAADVAMGCSVDGFYMYVFYYDHNSQVVGGYLTDCIKR